LTVKVYNAKCKKSCIHLISARVEVSVAWKFSLYPMANQTKGYLNLSTH